MFFVFIFLFSIKVNYFFLCRNCNEIGYLNCDDQTCATNSLSQKLCGISDVFSVIDNVLTGTNSFFLEDTFLDAGKITITNLKFALNKFIDGLFSPFFDDLFKFQAIFPLFGNILTDSLNWITNWIGNKLSELFIDNILYYPRFQ